MTFWCSVRIFGNDPQSTIINHPSNPRFPAKHQQGICTSTPRASSSLVALRVTLASQAASALAPVRARVLVIFSRDCGTNLFFFCWGLSNCQSPYRYTVLYIHLLSYIIFLIPGSIQGKIHRNLCYYRPITVQIVSPRSHHQTIPDHLFFKPVASPNAHIST